MNRVVSITGIGIDIPAVRSLDALVEPPNAGIESRHAPVREAPVSGALRYKDRATRMALLAAKRALESAGLPTVNSDQASPHSFGVVVSSNLGNVDTVCRVAKTIEVSSTRDVRPMDLPNASSNVIASTLAITYGCKAVNLMICNGAHSGIDALHMARNVIRTGRAERMLVVGVEPLNDVVALLMQQSSTAQSVAAGSAAVAEGAAAVVVESADAATTRNAPVFGHLTGYGYDAGMDVSRSVQAAFHPERVDMDLWLTPGLVYRDTAASVGRAIDEWDESRPRTLLDLTSLIGELYGALGVLQCIAACLWLRAHSGQTAVTTTGACWGDGSSSLIIAATPQNARRHVRATAAMPRPVS
jgi:3-oxoacyl-[acyl-carrier-protein] synthase II